MKGFLAAKLKKETKETLSMQELENIYIYIFFFFYHLFIYFKDLFTERACPQLHVAKANLGGPCLNKQITKELIAL